MVDDLAKKRIRLAQLEEMAAAGITNARDSFGNSVSYRSLSELLRAIEILRREIYPSEYPTSAQVRFKGR